MAARADGAGVRLVLLGPPNSGKGTQARAVAERLGVPAVSTGDMLRLAVAEGSELGRRVGSILDAGELVDDATMADLVRERLGRPDTSGGFLLDGYPRTAGQAVTLREILTAREEELTAVLLLEVAEEALVERGRGRGRADDDVEVLRERLRVYREQTAPLIGYYSGLGLLRKIDGDRPIEEVTSHIFAALGVETVAGA